jgi:ferredoxin
VKGEKKKKIIKTIKIDVDKCNGCRACEVICSAFHAAEKYSSVNPARARIRVIREPLTDIYVPVYAGDYAPAECAGRDKYTSVPSAELPARPGTSSKNPIPVFPSDATCVKTIRHKKSPCVFSGA